MTTSTDSSSSRSRSVPAAVGVPETPEQVRATLGAIGLRPSRTFGQSFLSDPFVADAEAALLEVPPEAPVLEIGGGLGVLTAAVLRRHPGPLAVVERDPHLVAHLRRTFGPRIRLLEGDALSMALPPAAAVIGNLPYSIATPLLLRLFAARVPRVVFLVQREVAERLGAGPGSKTYGRLSIIARLYGEIELFRIVPADAFTPRPAVASRIAVHRTRTDPLPVPSVPDFEEVVRRLFSGRRKQLGNLLPPIAGGDARADRAADRAAWPADWRRRRPEQLPPEAFFALATALHDRA